MINGGKDFEHSEWAGITDSTVATKNVTWFIQRQRWRLHVVRSICALYCVQWYIHWWAEWQRTFVWDTPLWTDKASELWRHMTFWQWCQQIANASISRADLLYRLERWFVSMFMKAEWQILQPKAHSHSVMDVTHRAFLSVIHQVQIFVGKRSRMPVRRTKVRQMGSECCRSMMNHFKSHI